ncbi:hypothetical protein B0J12DRAFT_666779 [Macrophomina phaseolina]|uniref:Uncharacterized protein n=1 Tax=Macrophomina phaseolina TaxID=35725 RepID=A0ABQ8GA89_9PEZI|nr:hypothetical protein B0J12DRAFT_666779 [Macrophomina phaseolina]
MPWPMGASQWPLQASPWPPDSTSCPGRCVSPPALLHCPLATPLAAPAGPTPVAAHSSGSRHAAARAPPAPSRAAANRLGCVGPLRHRPSCRRLGGVPTRCPETAGGAIQLRSVDARMDNSCWGRRTVALHDCVRADFWLRKRPFHQVCIVTVWGNGVGELVQVHDCNVSDGAPRLAVGRLTMRTRVVH